MPGKIQRCSWVSDDPLMTAYHDEEWGVPLHDDQRLFEFLVLEGAQAGLSWSTVLRKRENFRKAFQGFDPAIVARLTPRDVELLMKNEVIIRNRLKIGSAVTNARLVLAIQKEFGSFDAYLWHFVGNKPIRRAFNRHGEIPATTEVSEALSRDMKKRGFKFVGSTICYAFMQAVGMVNDHVTECFRYGKV